MEVRYEGYGPAGVAVIVEALTDNRNRTASDVRSAFAKHGGALGETNSVSFLFNRLGVIRYPAGAAAADDMLEAAIEAGADNVESDAEAHEVTCAVDDFFAVRDALETPVRRAGDRQAGLAADARRSRWTRQRAGSAAETARRAGGQRRRAERLRQLRHSGGGDGSAVGVAVMDDLYSFFAQGRNTRVMHKWHHYFEVYERHMPRFRTPIRWCWKSASS